MAFKGHVRRKSPDYCRHQGRSARKNKAHERSREKTHVRVCRKAGSAGGGGYLLFIVHETNVMQNERALRDV